MKRDSKRQNFNVSPEQEAEIAWLQGELGMSTVKDTILRAVKVLAVLKREVRGGKSLYVHSAAGDKTRLVIPELEGDSTSDWTYLVSRPHPWRRQLYMKGRKLLAFTVWSDMVVNHQSAEVAALEWDLPVAAIEEAVRYCESHKDLLGLEADEAAARAGESGVRLGA